MGGECGSVRIKVRYVGGLFGYKYCPVLVGMGGVVVQ